MTALGVPQQLNGIISSIQGSSINPSFSNEIKLASECTLRVGNETITAKQLELLIKIFKKQYPEILI